MIGGGRRRARGLSPARVALVGAIVVCMAYAPIAMTELWPYASPGAPALGQRILTEVVSPRYVAGALATRLGPYQRSLIPMVVHSVLGGLLMLLGPVQLLTAVRRRRRLHRAAGIAFAATVYLSMAGAGVYLVRTRPVDTFSGPAFWVALVAILIGTVLSVTLGIVAAVRRMPDLHQRWMLLCFGFLMSAPVLRFEWGALPVVYPGLSMMRINEIANTHLGAVCAFGGLLAARAVDRRATVRGVEGTWVPRPALIAAHAIGLTALIWIGWEFLRWGGDGPRRLLGYLVPFAATWVVMAYAQHRAARAGRTWAWEEWRVQQAFFCLAPVLSLAVAVVVGRFMHTDPMTSMTAGVSVGCGTMAVFATVVVSLRLYRARAAVRRPAARAVAVRLELGEAGRS